MKDRANNTNTARKAAGFLNLKIRDANGVWHQFKTGIPLHMERKLDEVLLNNTNIVGELARENIDLSIHVVEESPVPAFGQGEEEAPAAE